MLRCSPGTEDDFYATRWEGKLLERWNTWQTLVADVGRALQRGWDADRGCHNHE